MSRPVPTVTALVAALASAQEPDGSPLSARARKRLASAVAAARADILRAIDAAEGDRVGAVAARIGVARSTLATWRAPGGWLHVAELGWKTERGAGAFDPPGSGWSRVSTVRLPDGSFAVRAMRGVRGTDGDVLYGPRGRVLAEGTDAADAALGL